MYKQGLRKRNKMELVEILQLCSDVGLYDRLMKNMADVWDL